MIACLGAKDTGFEQMLQRRCERLKGRDTYPTKAFIHITSYLTFTLLTPEFSLSGPIHIEILAGDTPDGYKQKQTATNESNPSQHARIFLISHRRPATMLKFLIGIAVPYIGVIGLLPWVASVDKYVFGVPFVYAWLFAWFIVTTLCLLACWYLFDRHTGDDESPAPTSQR